MSELRPELRPYMAIDIGSDWQAYPLVPYREGGYSIMFETAGVVVHFHGEREQLILFLRELRRQVEVAQ